MRLPRPWAPPSLIVASTSDRSAPLDRQAIMVRELVWIADYRDHLVAAFQQARSKCGIPALPVRHKDNFHDGLQIK